MNGSSLIVEVDWREQSLRQAPPDDRGRRQWAELVAHMLETTAQIRVPVEADSNGVLRLIGTRVTLDSIMSAWQRGATPEEIAMRFPSVSVRDVYAVCAWALGQLDDVERYLEEQRGHADDRQSDVVERFGLTGLRQRLLARQG